ncbi:MAG: zinc metallopeptidase, partial [Oscillospiraceae bacterium]|nr:zinc metallopeptidase [Oscillospiraceae bacterium]
IQHAQGYSPIKIRQAIIPITQIGSRLAVPLVLLGMLISAFQWLIPVGIFLYAGVVLFQAVTLPVEFNASGRALKTLDENVILYKDEVRMAKKVLTAAAMTYVAAMFSSLMSLLRLILLSNRGRRR